MTTRSFLSAKFLSVLGTLTLMTVGTVAFTARDARANHRADCPKHLKQRSAEETIRQHLALMEAGDLDTAMCDYAEDAVVVLPNQEVTGLDNIRAGLSGVGTLLGGVLPQVQTLTATSSVVMITFTAIGSPCTIPDGSDTYIVERGQIVTQTVHDTFHSAPGQTCPVAAPGQ